MSLATFSIWRFCTDSLALPEVSALTTICAASVGFLTAGTPKLGYLEPAAYERTVKVLLAGGESPVIKKDPGKAAYSHAVWEASK